MTDLWLWPLEPIRQSAQHPTQWKVHLLKRKISDKIRILNPPCKSMAKCSYHATGLHDMLQCWQKSLGKEKHLWNLLHRVKAFNPITAQKETKTPNWEIPIQGITSKIDSRVTGQKYEFYFASVNGSLVVVIKWRIYHISSVTKIFSCILSVAAELNHMFNKQAKEEPTNCNIYNTRWIQSKNRGQHREVFQYTLSAEDFVERQVHDLPACQLLPAAELLPVKLVLV